MGAAFTRKKTSRRTARISGKSEEGMMSRNKQSTEAGLMSESGVNCSDKATGAEELPTTSQLNPSASQNKPSTSQYNPSQPFVGLSPTAFNLNCTARKLNPEKAQQLKPATQAPTSEARTAALRPVGLHRHFFRCRAGTSQLHKTLLDSGKQLYLQVPLFQFEYGCSWCEVPGGALLITGGGQSHALTSIDVQRELAVTTKPPMQTARFQHCSVYYADCLYVLGGYSHRKYLRRCERYVCTEKRWEAIPMLPRACECMSAVETAQSLYVFGGRGNDTEALDLIQKLSLVRLTWEVLEVKLPQPCFDIACFKLRSEEVYFVIDRKLYNFQPHQVQLVGPLPQDILQHLNRVIMQDSAVPAWL
jgi:hypothetical protein